MSKKNKVIIVISVVLMFCAMFILLTRRFSVLEFGYKSLNLDESYIELNCEFAKETKFKMTQKEDVNNFIAELNNAKVRKTDFLDEIIDKTEQVTNGYRIEMKKEDGTTDSVVLAYSTENNIGKLGYIFYNGVRYKVKDELSEYILYLLDNYKSSEIKEVNKVDGIEIVMNSEKYSVHDTEITAQINNSTDEEYVYGEKYYLEFMRNETWHVVLPKYESLAGGEILPKQTKVERIYNLKRYYDLEEGKYRLVEELSDNNGNKYYIATKFVLTEKK